MREDHTRTYHRARSIVFLKTNERFGGLSNMAGGFSLRINGTRILTSEALYQACRFPHRPDVQRLIIEQTSPMTAKMKSKPHRQNSRPDWDQVRVKIMRWCLRVKLAQNWRAFSELLLETAERPIVEESRKDDFWGAKPTDEETLVGMNVLGRLLMELREAVKNETRESLTCVQPLCIPDFLLGGQQIGAIAGQDADAKAAMIEHAGKPFRDIGDSGVARQESLFYLPVAKEAPPPPYLAASGIGVRIAGLIPFAEYKDSGLPWLGQVPEHWVTERTKWRFRNRKELNSGGQHKNILSLTLRGVVNNNPDNPEGMVPKDYRTYQFFAKGDLVFKLIDLENLRTSRVGLVHEDGIMSSAYVRLVPSGQANIGYYFHQFYDLYSRGIYNQLGAGVRSTLGASDLLNVCIVTPPPAEQAAIVRFLDWANGRLERAIRAKQKVIGLLGEQKQAIIHRAVTRGLNPSAPLKPSGIPWLGDIPQHWELQRLGRAIRLLTGFPFASSSFAHGQSGVRLARGINVTPNGLRWNAVVRWERRPGDGLDEFQLQIGDIVLGMDRPIITAGVRVAAIEGKDVPSLLLQRVARLRPTARLDAKFLLLLLRGRLFCDYMAPIFTGISVPHLSPEQIKGFMVALPAIEEQQEIVAEIELATGHLHIAISRLEREIELLREYRTRLVADVVTGKLDVREAALHLSDEAPPDLIEDDADLNADPDTVDEEAAA